MTTHTNKSHIHLTQREFSPLQQTFYIGITEDLLSQLQHMDQQSRHLERPAAKNQQDETWAKLPGTKSTVDEEDTKTIANENMKLRRRQDPTEIPKHGNGGTASEPDQTQDEQLVKEEHQERTGEDAQTESTERVQKRTKAESEPINRKQKLRTIAPASAQREGANRKRTSKRIAGKTERRPEKKSGK